MVGLCTATALTPTPPARTASGRGLAVNPAVAVLTAPEVETQALPAEDMGRGRAVVIGGGPAGLAAALEIRRRTGSEVTVLETSKPLRDFDPERAFLYLIDGRG